MENQRKKELKQAFKMQPTFYGVVQIKNNVNGKIFIDAVANLKNRWQFYQLNLNSGNFGNRALLADWQEQKGENFSYEVLWEKENAEVKNMKDELRHLKKSWLEQLQPFEEAGYHQRRELDK
ncbi:GIY-YIG nuclease family protein [Enterococcus timonensis]|uniref:GIY-YIG nuclease family protein n=1 Tax=Enterococcus timonensis TaxID=1852364 RepID=UPI0008DA319F|nr:GIY-YIG nuclease family protein [Enterococcus timonensis]